MSDVAENPVNTVHRSEASCGLGSRNVSRDVPGSVACRLASAIDRLAAAIEEQNRSLGSEATTRYTRSPENAELVDEKTMAKILTIPRRTLAYHREQGRMPGCWVKNGRRILWHVLATREAWRKGIG